jgi:hypothetical protein
MPHFIFGLIDPRTQRVFYVGCGTEINEQLRRLPKDAAAVVAFMAPYSPQLVILQTVDSAPSFAWVKGLRGFAAIL